MSELNEANETEWERLEQQIELSSDFWLGFLFSPGLKPVNIIRERVQRLVEQRNQSFLRFRPSQPSELRDVLIKLVEDQEWAQAGCVWLEINIVDAPALAVRPWHDAIEQFFLRLNERRDALRPHLRGFLVIEAHPDTKALVREAAPDLWSIRSIVVELDAQRRSYSDAPAASLPARALSISGPQAITDGSVVEPYNANHELSKQPLTYMSTPASTSLDPNFSMAEARRRGSILGKSASSAGPEQQASMHISLGQALLQGAQGYLAQGDFRQAKNAAEEALSHLHDADPLDKSNALFVLAQCEYGLRHIDDAINHILLALYHHQKNGNKNSHNQAPAYWYDYAGKIFFAKNQLSEAEYYYKEAVRCAKRSINAQAPSRANELLFRELSTYLKHWGEAQLRRANSAGALEVFGQALAFDRTLAEINRESPQEYEGALEELAFSLTRMGDLEREAGDSHTALAAYEESVAIHRRLAETEGPRSLRNLSIALNRIGRVWLDADEPLKAMPLFEDSSTLRKNIIANYGETSSRLDELLSSLSKYALSARACECWSKAESCFVEMAVIAQKLSADPLLRQKAMAYLAESRSGLIAVLRAQGKERAAQELEAALEDNTFQA